MQIEYIAGISLTAGRTTEQQGECTVCRCMLTQIIIHYQYVFPVFHPLLTDGTSGIRSNVLQGSQVAGRGYHYRGIRHGAILLQSLYNVRNRGSLLADCNINTFYILSFLIDYGIDGNGSFTCLTVTDNQLTLSPSHRNHGIDSLDTGLKRCVNTLSCDNAACHPLNLAILCGLYRALAINGLPQRIDHTSSHGITYRNLNHPAGSPDCITFIDVPGASQQNHTHVIFFQIQYHAVNFTGKFQQLTLHGIFQSMDTGNTIRNLDYRTHVGYIQGGCISLDLILDNRTNFFWS